MRTATAANDIANNVISNFIDKTFSHQIEKAAESGRFETTVYSIHVYSNDFMSEILATLSRLGYNVTVKSRPVYDNFMNEVYDINISWKNKD